jgi:phosphoenolpyruvate-protein phosphotransferase
MARAILAGRSGSPGLGSGTLIHVLVPPPSSGLHDGGEGDLQRGSPEAADARLRAALATAARQLEALAVETSRRAGDEIGAIFEAQALFARDPALVEPALASLQSGLSAVEAIEIAAAEQADRLAAVDDDYFQARAADIRDVARRVVGVLLGRAQRELHNLDGRPAILVADDLDASTLASLRPELVAGIALGGGAPNGHLAIVARAVGVPVVLGLGDAIASAVDGEPAAVDGTGGRLLLDPSPADLSSLIEPLAGSHTIAVTSAPHADPGTPVLPVAIEGNVGSLREAEQAARADAAGIGLVRTELLFLGRTTPPGVGEQARLYRGIAATMQGRPVVFRTLDIGGDKPAAYRSTDAEANPALGVRGLRLGLRQPELLDDQLTALVDAAGADSLRVLFPMVSTIEELESGREALEAVIARRQSEGRSTPSTVLVGIMVEIPSAAIMADQFAPLVDFFSIGTNDLVQYTFAADRLSPALTELGTPYQPALLRLVASVTQAAANHGRPVAVCGEAAADRLLAPLLVGLGVTELSVAPAAIAPLRDGLVGLEIDRCRRAAAEALGSRTAHEVRAIANALVGLPDTAG